MRTFLCVVAVACLTGPARAQAPKATGSIQNSQLAERFGRADTNGDGVIDGAEARAAGLWFEDDFNSVDVDRSGTVTVFELGQALQQRLSHLLSEFDAADTDHDGTLSEDELKRTPNLWKLLTGGSAGKQLPISRPEFESYALDRISRQSGLPSVAPNLIEKRF